MSVNSTYSPSMFVEFGYIGTKYSYMISQLLIHEYLPYLGEGGYLDVSGLDSTDSSDTFGFTFEYGLTVVCIPGLLFAFGLLSIIFMLITAYCQKRKRCCRCCQCYPKERKKCFASCRGQQVGPVRRSKELALLFGEDDPRSLAAESREKAQDEKHAIARQRKRVKRYLVFTGIFAFLCLLPTLYANYIFDTVVTELQDITGDVKAKLEYIGTHTNSWSLQMDNINERAVISTAGLACNSTRLESISPRIAEITAQQRFLIDVVGELNKKADVVIERIESNMAGVYRQLLLAVVFIWPLLAVYFMIFNIYKTEGAHCLGGLCIDGVDGVNQTVRISMGAFYLMLVVTVPFLTLTLAMADLCHSSPLEVLNTQVSGSVSSSQALPGSSLSVPDVTAFYASCNGTNPFSPFIDSARNSSDVMGRILSRISRYSSDSLWAPANCSDNMCVSCPNDNQVKIMTNVTDYLGVKINQTADALACSEFRPLYSGLVEDTLCGDVFMGTASLGLSQLLTSFLLFIGMWLMLLVRQHYTWLDNKREDADYDSDHEGFEKWNMKAHRDDSSSDGEEDGKKFGEKDSGDEGDGEDPVLGLLKEGIDGEETKEPDPAVPLDVDNDVEANLGDNDSVGGYSRKSLDDLDSMMTGELRLKPLEAGSIFDDDDAYFNPNARPRTTGSVTASRRQAVQINLQVGGIHGTGKSILEYDADSLQDAMMIKPKTVEEIVHYEAENPPGYEDDD